MSAYQRLYEELIPPRPKDAHKGLFGHVLIVGGGLGMPGAVALAAKASLRVGAGMVTIATLPLYAQSALSYIPEAMIYGIEDPSDLDDLIARASVCVVGPGLGEDDWARSLFSKLLTITLPLVIDASALHLLAGNDVQFKSRGHWVLTPHPGEAALLLDCSAKEIQNNRQAAAARIQQQYGGTVVLKGQESLVVNPAQQVFLCEAGNPGMATAGMGDVLSGVIAGLIAQGVSIADAAHLGVWLHASAGDDAAKAYGERGLIASDLMEFLYQRSNPEKIK